MRLPRRYLSAAALLGVAVAVLPAIASSETTPVEAVNEGGGVYGETHRWSPSQETVIAGNAVTFRNMTAVRHGVNWINPPAKPVCDNTVPVGTTEATAGTNWSGTCTFAQAGTYTFYCTVHGAAMSGTITIKTPGTPIATTQAPSELTHATARLNGAVNPEGNATEYRFDYGTSTVSEHMTNTLSLGSEDFSSHAVSAALTGLTPGTSYHVQLVAIYGVGKTVLGSEQTFTTPVPAAPTVATGQATGLTESEATLKGTVDPNEGEATEYSFEYGTGLGYGQSTEFKSLSQTDRVSHPVSATLTKLAAGTEYHFRLVAHNKVGPAANGEDHTLKTASPPSSPPPSPTPTPPSSPSPVLMVVPIAPSEPLSGSLFEGGAHALRLTTSHGPSVRGSVDVSPAGAGGRLEVGLFASTASLARTHRPSRVRVGRFLRSSVKAGVVSFAVPLTAPGKSALRRHKRLALTVQIALTPLAGAPASVTRSVVLRG